MIKIFRYWFAHWCAFQLTALNLNCWKFIFLFHDMEKPFLRLFLGHKMATKLHRKLSRHHVEFIFPKYYDYVGMIIDWECAKLTKPEKQLNARQTMNKYYPQLCDNLNPILNKLGL